MQTVIRFTPPENNTGSAETMRSIGEKLNLTKPHLFDGSMDKRGGVSAVICSSPSYDDHLMEIRASIDLLSECISFAKSQKIDVSFDTGIWVDNLQANRSFHTFRIDSSTLRKLANLSIDYDVTIVYPPSKTAIEGISRFFSKYVSGKHKVV